MKIQRGEGNIAAALMLSVSLFLLFNSTAWGGGEEKAFYSGKNYVFSGNWTQEEINLITRLQDKARERLEQCLGYITPLEQETVLEAYERPMILHIKNNQLGKNIGAAVARHSTDNGAPLAVEFNSYYAYSAMQLNLKELLRRGEKEILKTLLHEMAHNASPNFTHPRFTEIWDTYAGRLKPGKARSEYYETIPVRIENCIRTNHFGHSTY